MECTLEECIIFFVILCSETMLKMWTDFARFGDPNGDPGLVRNVSRSRNRFYWLQAGGGEVVWNPGQTMVFGVSGEITGQREWRDRWAS